MNSETHRELKMLGVLSLVTIGALGASICYQTMYNKKLAPNAVSKYSLEIINKDINKDGKLETVVRYHNSNSVLKIEKNKDGGWSATPLNYKK